MIEHFYEQIEGRFTWPDFYSWLAREVPGNADIVEVGTFAGQSAAYLGVELILSREGFEPEDLPRLDLVDIFDAAGIRATRQRLAPIAGVLGTVHGCGSVEAAKAYADATLDAVFIDADHAYASVRADIDAWLPKVRPGGIIAGHDFCADYPGVVRAVTETFEEISVVRGEPYTGPGEASVVGPYFPVWWVRR